MLIHKTYLNVVPPRISELVNITNSYQRRRDPVFFEIPYNRLKSSHKSIAFQAPKLYNYTANIINKKLTSR